MSVTHVNEGTRSLLIDYYQLGGSAEFKTRHKIKYPFTSGDNFTKQLHHQHHQHPQHVHAHSSIASELRDTSTILGDEQLEEQYYDEDDAADQAAEAEHTRQMIADVLDNRSLSRRQKEALARKILMGGGSSRPSTGEGGGKLKTTTSSANHHPHFTMSSSALKKEVHEASQAALYQHRHALPKPRFLELVPEAILIPTRSGRNIRDEKMALLKRSLQTRAAMMTRDRDGSSNKSRKEQEQAVRMPRAGTGGGTAMAASSSLEQASIAASSTTTVHLGEASLAHSSPSSPPAAAKETTTLPILSEAMMIDNEKKKKIGKTTAIRNRQQPIEEEAVEVIVRQQQEDGGGGSLTIRYQPKQLYGLLLREDRRKRLEQGRREHRQLQSLLIKQRSEAGRSQQLAVAWQRRLDAFRSELSAYLLEQQGQSKQQYSKATVGEIMRILDDSMIYYLLTRYGGGRGVEGAGLGGEEGGGIGEEGWSLSPEMLLLLIGHPLGGGGGGATTIAGTVTATVRIGEEGQHPGEGGQGIQGGMDYEMEATNYKAFGIRRALLKEAVQLFPPATTAATDPIGGAGTGTGTGDNGGMLLLKNQGPGPNDKRFLPALAALSSSKASSNNPQAAPANAILEQYKGQGSCRKSRSGHLGQRALSQARSLSPSQRSGYSDYYASHAAGGARGGGREEIAGAGTGAAAAIDQDLYYHHPQEQYQYRPVRLPQKTAMLPDHSQEEGEELQEDIQLLLLLAQQEQQLGQQQGKGQQLGKGQQQLQPKQHALQVNSLQDPLPGYRPRSSSVTMPATNNAAMTATGPMRTMAAGFRMVPVPMAATQAAPGNGNSTLEQLHAITRQVIQETAQLPTTRSNRASSSRSPSPGKVKPQQPLAQQGSPPQHRLVMDAALGAHSGLGGGYRAPPSPSSRGILTAHSIHLSLEGTTEMAEEEKEKEKGLGQQLRHGEGQGEREEDGASRGLLLSAGGQHAHLYLPNVHPAAATTITTTSLLQLQQEQEAIKVMQSSLLEEGLSLSLEPAKVLSAQAIEQLGSHSLPIDSLLNQLATTKMPAKGGRGGGTGGGGGSNSRQPSLEDGLHSHSSQSEGGGGGGEGLLFEDSQSLLQLPYNDETLLFTPPPPHNSSHSQLLGGVEGHAEELQQVLPAEEQPPLRPVSQHRSSGDSRWLHGSLTAALALQPPSQLQQQPDHAGHGHGLHGHHQGHHHHHHPLAQPSSSSEMLQSSPAPPPVSWLDTAANQAAQRLIVLPPLHTNPLEKLEELVQDIQGRTDRAQGLNLSHVASRNTIGTMQLMKLDGHPLPQRKLVTGSGSALDRQDAANDQRRLAPRSLKSRQRAEQGMSNGLGPLEGAGGLTLVEQLQQGHSPLKTIEHKDSYHRSSNHHRGGRGHSREASLELGEDDFFDNSHAQYTAALHHSSSGQHHRTMQPLSAASSMAAAPSPYPSYSEKMSILNAGVPAGAGLMLWRPREVVDAQGKYRIGRGGGGEGITQRRESEVTRRQARKTTQGMKPYITAI